ncbi:MAG: M20/M25/M40 family metallo-hydrolase [Gemmataceae bacterium]|nr:M20/M25/M40 family metallo-hydrolase [Gemmataceae bacterium]MCS7269598.1 M20/M25/M40 family metallo-hydrolase [Gemmataceae bacterium]MDW8243558.1 M20/M25/M40 family metallo-hydrolase [Thermogemmata sp.]
MLPASLLRNPVLSAVGFLGLLLTMVYAEEVEVAPPPRPVAPPLQIRTPVDLDRAVLSEIRQHSEIMKNLQYLSDVIGARLTGSKNLERANQWAADKMREYGLVNVRLDPWEIPVGWQRGHALMRLVEPDTGLKLMVASAGWTPGTPGKVVGPVVILRERSKDKLAQYKGKLRHAVVLLTPPPTVAPVTDLRYGPGMPSLRKDDGKKETTPKEPAEPPSKKQSRLQLPPDATPLSWSSAQDVLGYVQDELQPGFTELNEFLKSEGVACIATSAAKPHALLVTTGGWPNDIVAAENRVPRVFMAHEHYALLWRLASQPNATVRVETDISNTFIRGPITVYNTVGELRGSEKPDEYVVVGAHLDSWDLASGTTDNGTGSCVVLEAARALSRLAQQGYPPKRTIRFVLFSGEEQGLHGSRRYVQRYKDELPKHSAAIVHDTGTGRVQGLALHNRKGCYEILQRELEILKELDGWVGVSLRSMGGTDHLSFNAVGVPGFACLQEMDEYRLTHHTQSDTFDKAKEPYLIQGAQVVSVTALRIANLPELLPR